MRRESDADAVWMAEALALARRGEGGTRPNPPVGAVIVRDGHCIGRGWHRVAGGPHAERVALRRAGHAARGATLYVSLEPCSTRGRTPACTEAILAAGIERVVMAIPDPNPCHQGRGARELRRRGVAVTVGVGRAEAAELLRPFAHWIAQGTPWVTLKLAMSLDGCIADARGRSRWISGPAARREVDRLRRRADAVLIGTGTALADNPSLLPRSGGKSPLSRVVLDRHGRLPLRLRLFNDAQADQTIAVLGQEAPETRAEALRRRGVAVWRLRSRGKGLSLKGLVGRLGREGVLSLLCEGGGKLAGSLLAQDLVNELILFQAPLVLGAGRPGVADYAWALDRAPRFQLETCRVLGSDMMVRLLRAER